MMQDLTVGMGLNKKAKYELYINKHLVYFFVTTTKTEADCIEILKEMAHNKPALVSRPFSIIKVKDGERKELFRGTIKKTSL